MPSRGQDDEPLPIPSCAMNSQQRSSQQQAVVELLLTKNHIHNNSNSNDVEEQQPNCNDDDTPPHDYNNNDLDDAEDDIDKEETMMGTTVEEDISDDSSRSRKRRWWYPTMPNGLWMVIIAIIMGTVAWVLTIIATSKVQQCSNYFDFNAYRIKGEGKLYCFNNGTCRGTNSLRWCECRNEFSGYSCQYDSRGIDNDAQQTSGGDLTCLNGGSLVYDEETDSSKCDCNTTDSMMDNVFAGSQCEYKATAICNIERFYPKSDGHEEAIVLWDSISNVDYRYSKDYSTITFPYDTECGDFQFDNIPDSPKGIEKSQQEISDFEAKINDDIEHIRQVAFVYGIVSLCIGGVSLISIYLGCWISYGRKVIACVTTGLLLAGSFTTAMSVSPVWWFYFCMNDTREKLNNGEIKFERDLYDICFYPRLLESSQGIAICAACFWFLCPVLGSFTFFNMLVQWISEKLKKKSEATAARNKAAVATQLEPKYIDDDEKPQPRPTPRKPKIPTWQKWENDERSAAANIEGTEKDIAISIVKKYIYGFQYAPDNIRADKDVVLDAVSKNAEMLKFALGGLNQDRDCWLAAGLWKEEQDTTKKDNNIKNKIVARIALSTKFSLGEDTHSSVTKFTKCINDHPYFNGGDFKIYSPNAFSKNTCDPEWTRLDWPCRGTFETCKYNSDLKTGPPQLSSCWRYSFRWHLEEAQKTNGFMIQVVDLQGRPGLFEETIFDYELGKGQQIEAEMAATVGTKIFRIYRPRAITKTGSQWLKDFRKDHVNTLASNVMDWYNSRDMDICEIYCEEQLGVSEP